MSRKVLHLPISPCGVFEPGQIKLASWVVYDACGNVHIVLDTHGLQRHV